MYRSTDGGSSWTFVERSSAGLIIHLALRGQQAVAVGGSGLMLRSSDGGTTWNALPKLDEVLVGKGAFVAEAHIYREDLGTYTQASLVAIQSGVTNGPDRRQIGSGTVTIIDTPRGRLASEHVTREGKVA